MSEAIVVIGAGLAGYGVVRAIRRINRDIKIVMVCDDSGDVYSKPQLSTVLAFGKAVDDLIQTPAQVIAEELNISLVANTRVIDIDTEASIIATSTDGSIHYTSLVLAMGANARKLAIQGDDTKRVLSVNSIDDYRQFHHSLGGNKRVAILGGGLIGCEFANDLLASGYKVSLIEPCAALLSTLVPHKVSDRLEEKFIENGAQLYLGRCASKVIEVEGQLKIVMDNNETVEADIVLSAVGIGPNIELARSSGLKVNRGVVVDEFLRTSVPNIYAIGDCAEIGGRVMPYVAPILAGSKALSQTLLGDDTPVTYNAMPIAIKTTLFPLVAAPIPLGADGHWNYEEDEKGINAKFENEMGDLIGMALGGAAVKNRAVLAPRLRPLSITPPV